MSQRANIKRQEALEPKRVESCEQTLTDLGYEVTRVGTTELQFRHRGSLVRFWPYSGWHTGKSIVDGRGFSLLLKQLKGAPKEKWNGIQHRRTPRNKPENSF